MCDVPESTIHSGFQKNIRLKLFLIKQQIVDEELIQSGFRMPYWLLTIWLDKLIILKNNCVRLLPNMGGDAPKIANAKNLSLKKLPESSGSFLTCSNNFNSRSAVDIGIRW